MHKHGVRGIRFNAITERTPIEWLPSLAKMIAPLGWHIQLWTNSARLLEMDAILDEVVLPIVLDDMGQFPAAEGVAGAQFQNLLRLMKDERFRIKLTGYRVSQSPPLFEDIKAAAMAITETAPDRCLWGTDCPHIDLEGWPMPNTTDLYETLDSWLNLALRQAILVDNPAQLYRFDGPRLRCASHNGGRLMPPVWAGFNGASESMGTNLKNLFDPNRR